MQPTEPITTTDSICSDRLKILQNKKGYRFSIDAPILAHHIGLKASDVAVDLGTGCGIIPLILSLRTPGARIYGIEIQSDLAELALRNVCLNKMEESITIIHGDMKDYRSYLSPGIADMVFSNPPYRKVLSGRINPEPERAVAKHEMMVRLSDVICIADGLLKPSGRLVMIYAAERAVDLVVNMRANKLEPKRLRFVHPKRNVDAGLVIVEGAKKGNPGLNVEPPLIIHQTDGEYTDEVREMVGG